MPRNPLLAGLPPVHPGEILAEDVLPFLKKEHGITKAAFAAHLHMSRQALENILKGRSAITPSTALRLGKLLGNGPDIWLRMQTGYDLEMAEAALAKELEATPLLTAA